MAIQLEELARVTGTGFKTKKDLLWQKRKRNQVVGFPKVCP
jgi:hypothetical protein